jgi:diaminopimelate decarboxylase
MDTLKEKKGRHVPMEQFHYQRGELLINGLTLWQVADIAGQTPFYIYDFEVVEKRVAALRRALPPDLHIHYSIKANPMPMLVQRIALLVDGLDVASLRELQLALATGISPRNVSFAGPGKRDHELAAALAAGVVINIESANELARLEQIQFSRGQVARVALRVNPEFYLRGSGMVMGGGSQQFGIDAELVGEVARGVERSELVGLHIFAGSQNLKTEALLEGVTHTFRLAARIAEELGVELQHLNIGGGLGIPYFPANEALDLTAYGEHLAQEAAAWQRRFPNCRLILELGRYLVGEAGLFVSRVIDKKISRGKIFLVVDGGLHQHLAASGNFGQLIRRNYPVSAITRKASAVTETVNIVGPLCTPLDLLGKDVELPVCEVGDLIVIYQSGAYGLTVSPIHFLSHPAPIELLL